MLALNSGSVSPWASSCRGPMAEKCILGGALETLRCQQDSSAPRSQHSAVQLTNSCLVAEPLIASQEQESSCCPCTLPGCKLGLRRDFKHLTARGEWPGPQPMSSDSSS